MALFGQVTSPESTRNDRCIGKPLDVVEKAAALDEQGRELPDGAAGLLGVKTPTRTPGYWNDPEMTKRFELAGYWLTGDVVRRDAEGRFYHLDRTVDVIDTATGPIYSLPIEEVLLADCSGGLWTVRSSAYRRHGSGQRPVATVRYPASTRRRICAHRVRKRHPDGQLTPIVADRREHPEFSDGVTGKVLKRELHTRLATLFTGTWRGNETDERGDDMSAADGELLFHSLRLITDPECVGCRVTAAASIRLFKASTRRGPVDVVDCGSRRRVARRLAAPATSVPRR